MMIRGKPSSTQRANQTLESRTPIESPRSAKARAARHLLPNLAAMMSASERKSLPHLHPKKLNGGLWFDIHDCIRKDIVAAWQTDFWGPWWNFGMVPLNKKESWWTNFVQKYYWDEEHHVLVQRSWETTCKESIRNLISKRKRSGKKPDYIGESDWNLMLEAWNEESNIKRSKINSKNRTSDPDGLGMHRHVAGAKKFSRIAYEMTIENSGIPPATTEVLRKTHTDKDGMFIDKRVEAIVLAAEMLATKQSSESHGSSHTGSTATRSSPQQLTAATTNKYQDVVPNESVGPSHSKHFEIGSRLTHIENSISEMKQSIEVILRSNGVDPTTLQPMHTILPPEKASSVRTPTSSESALVIIEQVKNRTSFCRSIYLT